MNGRKGETDREGRKKETMSECVCVCERERKRVSESRREIKWESVSVRVCVCTCLREGRVRENQTKTLI